MRILPFVAVLSTKVALPRMAAGVPNISMSDLRIRHRPMTSIRLDARRFLRSHHLRLSRPASYSVCIVRGIMHARRRSAIPLLRPLRRHPAVKGRVTSQSHPQPSSCLHSIGRESSWAAIHRHIRTMLLRNGVLCFRESHWLVRPLTSM